MRHIKTLSLISLALFASLSVAAGPRNVELLWPKGKMPDAQKHQYAAMTDVSGAEGFNPDKCRISYIRWADAPEKQKRNGCCMILISGGGYNNLCDVSLVKTWEETFTNLGCQCVTLVYRSPRPEGIPIYQTAWEDAQRAVRMVRSEAAKRGFDPSKIGVIGMSAGGHLATLLATSSQTKTYERIDEIDDISCEVNWAIANAPAYILTDGLTGRNARQGYGTDVKIDSVFRFDSKTCPMCLCHGGIDVYSPIGSTRIYRELRKRRIPAEVHLFPDKKHGAYGLDRAVEFMRQMGYLGPLEPEEKILDRFSSDEDRAQYIVEDIWPEGKMPDPQANQCKPYIEWHIPANLTTKAIQIIYSGGAYNRNSPGSFEVTPARRYLNAKGMTVVTLQYRSPRPLAQSGLDKHTTAWQDLQRAIRIVRSEAKERGLDPDRIGIMGSSAGGHLTLMGVTSSMHQSYLPIDKTDAIPCNVQWGIGIYPAYTLTDGVDQHNVNKGNLDTDRLVPEFSFDLKTCPMLLIHGDADGWSAMGSVKIWEQMRSMGIQSELHTLVLRPHCFHRQSSPGTGSYTHLDRIWEFLSFKKFNQ